MLKRATFVLAVTVVFAGAAPGPASALFIKSSLKKATKVAKKAATTVANKAKTTATTVANTTTKAATTVAATTTKAATAVAGAATSAVSAVKHFGQKFVDEFRQTAQKTWASALQNAKGLQQKAKAALAAAASKLNQAAQRAIIAKMTPAVEAAKKRYAPYIEKFQKALADPKLKVKIQNVLRAAAKKQVTRAVFNDLRAIAQYLGIQPKGASLGRRGEVAPCADDCYPAGIAIGGSIGAEAIIGGEMSTGIGMTFHGGWKIGAFAAGAWSLGVKVGVGADVGLWFPQSMENLGGYGVGLAAALHIKFGGGISLDWPSEDWSSSPAKIFTELSKIGKGCWTLGVTGGGGLEGGISLVWSHSQVDSKTLVSY